MAINYEELKTLSPSQVRALIPAAGMLGGAFDWNEFHRVTDNFWKTHNDDAARSEIPQFARVFPGGPAATTPAAAANPLSRGAGQDPFPGMSGRRPAAVAPSMGPAVQPGPPPEGTPFVDDGAVPVPKPSPAAIAAQKNVERFANDPILGKVFGESTTPTATPTAAPPVAPPGAAPGVPAAPAPLVFQNEDEMLQAAMLILNKRFAPPAAKEVPTMQPLLARSRQAQSGQQPKAAEFPVPAMASPFETAQRSPTPSTGVGSTASGASSAGLGLGARVNSLNFFG
jgi:hypothetical protein